MKDIKIAGFDVETNGLVYMADGQDPKNDVACVTFYLSDLDKKIFLPLNMMDLDEDKKLSSLGWIVRIVEEYHLVGHNATFDALQLMKLGIPAQSIRVIGDSQILAKMTQHRKVALKDMVVEYGIETQENVTKFDQLVPDYDSTRMSITDTEFVKYAVNDAYWAYMLEAELVKKYQSYVPNYIEEVKNVVPFARMTVKGMKINYQGFVKYRRAYDQEVLGIKNELDTMAGFDFRVQSRKDKAIVFEKLGIPDPPIKTKSGAVSYAKEALTYCKGHPFVDKLLDVIRNFDVQGTLATIEKYLPNDIPEQPHMHPFYKFVGEDGTSRVYTQNPSTNSLPMEFREFIVPEDGNSFLYMDWSGAELMLAAFWSNETWLIEAYESGKDIHREISSRLLDKPVESISDEDREVSKIVVFSVMFGSEGGAASRALKISFNEGAKLVNAFWNTCPNMLALRDRMLENAMKTGFTETITGRKRRLPKLYSQDRIESDKGKRQVFNTAIQSSVADLQKIFIRRAFDRIDNQEEWKKVSLMTTVFDSFTFEIPPFIQGYQDRMISDINEMSKFNIRGTQINFRYKFNIAANYRAASGK